MCAGVSVCHLSIAVVAVVAIVCETKRHDQTQRSNERKEKEAVLAFVSAIACVREGVHVGVREHKQAEVGLEAKAGAEAQDHAGYC